MEMGLSPQAVVPPLEHQGSELMVGAVVLPAQGSEGCGAAFGQLAGQRGSLRKRQKAAPGPAGLGVASHVPQVPQVAAASNFSILQWRVPAGSQDGRSEMAVAEAEATNGGHGPRLWHFSIAVSTMSSSTSCLGVTGWDGTLEAAVISFLWK